MNYDREDAARDEQDERLVRHIDCQAGYCAACADDERAADADEVA